MEYSFNKQYFMTKNIFKEVAVFYFYFLMKIHYK